MLGTKQAPSSPREKDFVRRWQAEVDAVELGTGVGAAAMVAVHRELREYECSEEFIQMNLKNFDRPIDLQTSAIPGIAYSPQNFQYGTFYYHGFVMLFEHPKVQPHVERAVAGRSEFLMLGANVGNEAFYGALAYGLRTRAVEILCDLVEKAKAVQLRHVPPEKFELTFECNDCLKVNMEHAKLVYIDNEIWDNFLTTALYRKMGKELPVGALVIGWHKNVHQIEDGWKDLGSVQVATSWASTFSNVYVLERVEAPTKLKEACPSDSLMPSEATPIAAAAAASEATPFRRSVDEKAVRPNTPIAHTHKKKRKLEPSVCNVSPSNIEKLSFDWRCSPW